MQQDWGQSLGTELPGLSLTGFEFHIMPGLDTPLNLDLHLSVPGYGREAGSLLLVRARVLGSDARDVPGVMEGEARRYPVELGHPGIWTDSYDVKLPAGYAVDETAEPVKVDLPFVSYRSSVAAKGDELHFEREYEVKQVEVPAAQAAEFRKLEEAIITDEKAMAVLKKEKEQRPRSATQKNVSRTGHRPCLARLRTNELRRRAVTEPAEPAASDEVPRSIAAHV